MSDHPPLSTDMNADRWAKEFVALHGGNEDLMRTWFANAIMCGWDNHYWTTSEYKTTVSEHLTSPSWSIPLITMTKLSPAAQTVLDAFRTSHTGAGCLAAALRAAADQAEDVCPARPSTEWGEGWLEGVKDVVAGFRRIATELEAQ